MEGKKKMATTKVEFKGHNGDMLVARLDTPSGKIHGVVLMAHCFTCSKDIPAARRIAQKLTAHDFAVLRFDFTGLGHSAGEFANSNFTTNVADLICAADFLLAQGMAPALLIGHSLGGAAVIKAAPQIASVKAVVTIGAPADPSHVAHNFSECLTTIAEWGQALVELAGRQFTIRQQFVEDIQQHALEDALANFNKRALLVLHSPVDTVVGIDNAADIFMAAKHPKSFVTLDDADHLVSRPEDAEYLAEVITAWSLKYIPVTENTITAAAPEGVVRVLESDSDGFRQDVVINNKHRMVADEPLSFGGTDMGASPYQLVSAGLGACTAMTIRMYARRKQWPLDDVWVDVSHNKRHVESCETCDKPGKMDVFDRVVYLHGDLSIEQQQRLLEIANKCPVHKTLHSASEVTTRLALNS